MARHTSTRGFLIGKGSSGLAIRHALTVPRHPTPIETYRARSRRLRVEDSARSDDARRRESQRLEPSLFGFEELWDVVQVRERELEVPFRDRAFASLDTEHQGSSPQRIDLSC